MRGPKKLRPVNCDQKKEPLLARFFGPASGQTEKKVPQTPTAEGPKTAYLEQFVANLSKEAKIRTWDPMNVSVCLKPVKRRVAVLAPKNVFLLV